MHSTHGERILDLLLAISATLEDDQRRELESIGLTPPRTHVMWIVHHGGPQTQVSLAHAMGVTPRHVTTLVDVLEENGFVERTRHPDDRRAILVSLTAHGDEIMQVMARDHAQLGTDLTGGLDAATRTALLTGLEHVNTRLRDLVAEHRSRQERQ